MPVSTITLPSETLTSARNTKVYIMARSRSGEIPQAADLVPNVADVSFDVSGSTTVVDIYGVNYSRSVKTARNATLSFTFHASSGNAVAQVLLDADEATGANAQVLYLLELEDGTEYYGAGVVEAANPVTGVSDANGFEVSITSDGAVNKLNAS